MPFAPHIRMTALGRLGSGSGERFSYGLNIDNGANATPLLQPNQAVWNDFAEDVRAFHANPLTRINPRAVLEEVKFARIGPDGKYTEDPVIVNVVDTPGGSDYAAGIPLVTPQTALACSLMTGTRGPRGKGRFYIPMPTVNLESDTLAMSDLERDIIQTQVATLITNLGNQPGFEALDLRVVVASSFGANHFVTGVRVGRAIDTIRSRRRSISERYDPVTAVSQ